MGAHGLPECGAMKGPTPVSKRRATDKTPENIEKFLTTLADGGTIAAGAKAAGVHRATAYKWRDEDPEFAAAWDEAIEQGTDALEDEAKRRAVEGVKEPVFHKGEICGHVQRYSDTLLIFMLKARRPEKYRETVRNEHTGADGGPIQTVNRELSHAERLQEIARIYGDAPAPGAGQTTH